jgi:flagellar biosynthesis/type III secretory pathway protein FliH
MEKYKETDTAIKEAKADYENFLTDAQLREAQFEHEMFLHDQAQAKSDAHKEGYEEGMERGIATGIEQGIATGTEREEHAKAVAVAKNMKALGMAADVIEKVSGLTADEISEL